MDEMVGERRKSGMSRALMSAMRLGVAANMYLLGSQT